MEGAFYDHHNILCLFPKLTTKYISPVKAITRFVINTRKPSEIKGLRVFFVAKRGEKPIKRFTGVKQYMEICIQIVKENTQYLVFFLLTPIYAVWYTDKAPPFLGG